MLNRENGFKVVVHLLLGKWPPLSTESIAARENAYRAW